MKIEQDKVKHFIVGFGITVVGGLIFIPLAALGFLSGFVKEWIDSMGYGQVEDADIWFTCAGAALGCVVLIFYVWLKIRR
jgi:hypothetical protein